MGNRLDAYNSIVRRTGVPDGWRETTVGDLARIVGGGTPDRDHGAYWRDGTVPWITPTDLTANRSKYIEDGAQRITELALRQSNATLVPPNSIVMSTRGTVGNFALATRPLTCNQSCEVLVPRANQVDAGFLYYLLQFGRSAFLRLSGGTTFGSITRRDIGRVRFAVPAVLDEQIAIARLLDGADVAMLRTRTAIDAAEDLRSSTITDLLSYGIAPNGHTRRGDGDDHDLVQSPLGTLPSSWRQSTVAAEFQLQSGFTLNAEREPRYRRRRYLRVANVQRDALDLSDVQELEAGDREFELRTLEVDDLLVVEGHADRMQIGRCARILEAASRMTFQNHLFRLRSNGAVDPGFASLWLNSTYAKRYWNARCATSSGLNTINQRTLKKLVVPVPSMPEQLAIAKIADAQRQYVEALTTNLTRLETLKQSLMHDLLTARVRISDDQRALVQ
jgi:type I restriction enzyme S subunit